MLARLGEGDLPGNSAGFFDLGLDSVALVNIGATVERELGVPVRPTLIFEHPTILALSDHLYGLIEDDQSETVPLQDVKLQSNGPVAQTPPALASGSASVASSAITSELAALKALLR